MDSELFFDRKELYKGNFYKLKSEIRTNEGERYEIEEWVGRGGNASVFKGRHLATGNDCAIKFLMSIQSQNTMRFSREVKLLQKIQDDHVTQYQGTGRVTVRHNKQNQNNRLPFVVMELAECNLEEKIRKEFPLSFEQYASQFRGLASALAAVHNLAVHRDIKPENILVVGERWLLSDYGLCTYVNPNDEDLTPDGINVGPKFWLSPEAHNKRVGRGDEINAASDVFQLAAIFWYVVTGRHPSGIVTEEDWDGPDRLFNVLHKSLYHDYRKRPQNGREFFSQLEAALNK